MSYAVIQIEKFKAGNLGGVSHHINRTSSPANVAADRTPLNRVLVGSDDPAADVRARLNEAGIKRPRKDATLAVGVLLTSDRKFFENAAGKIEPDKVEKWQKKNVEWLQNRYGKNLVNVTLHLDETTPHLHALVVPLTADNRLNYRHAFADGRAEMAKLHTDYAQSMRPLGLKRGAERTRASAEKLEDHYQRVNTPTPEITPAPAAPIARKPGVSGRLNPEQYAQDQLDEYRQQVEQWQKANANELKTMHAHSLEAERLRKREIELLLQHERVLKELNALKATADVQRKALAEVRGLSSHEAFSRIRGEKLAPGEYHVIEGANGRLEVDPAGRWRHQQTMPEDRWKSNAIDFVVALEGCDAKTAGMRLHKAGANPSELRQSLLHRPAEHHLLSREASRKAGVALGDIEDSIKRERMAERMNQIRSEYGVPKEIDPKLRQRAAELALQQEQRQAHQRQEKSSVPGLIR